MGDRFELLSRLGTGGFGTVYRARMTGSHGFQRDVALKLLDEDKADAEVLGRFRDEARLLGRIRHPNIPSVSAPVQTDQGWAMAMDLVPGVDCGRLLKKGGPLPLGIALEVTSVVAQTLHDLHHWKDLDEEQELQLLHRDIKPSNIMITSRGGIRLLDFGSARARFEARESHTTEHIGGTVGYIPPERLEGSEGPAGDVYALGVVLHSFVAGDKPPPLTVETHTPYEPPPTAPPEVAEVLRFAHQMRAIDPAARPSALEVVEFCRNRASEPTVRVWATGQIPEYAPRSADDRVGQVLTEVEPKAPRAFGFPVLAAAVLLTAVLFAGLGGLATLQLAPNPAVPSQTAQTPAAEPVPASVVEPASVEPGPASVEPEPAPATDSDEPTTDSDEPTTDSDEPEPTEPEPTEPEPEPTEAVAEAPVPSAPSPSRPRPSPAPEPLPPPRPTGTVVLTGEIGTAAVLRQGKRRARLTFVEPGAYDLLVTWDGIEVQAGSVDVRGDDKIVLRCRKRFQRCVP